MTFRFDFLLGGISLLPFFIWVQCQQPEVAKTANIFGYFKALPAMDTLHVEVSLNDLNVEKGDTIPNHLFFTTIPPSLLQEINHVADSSMALVIGRRHFPLGPEVEAYWVEIRQFWFQHHSLLVYNKAQKVFTDRITLAEWYGGDGGQVLIGSWLFDVDGDKRKDVIQHEIEHSMIPADPEPIETNTHKISVLIGKNGRFTATSIVDSALLIKKYPIRSFWE
jgi:hypothetical protein